MDDKKIIGMLRKAPHIRVVVDCGTFRDHKLINIREQVSVESEEEWAYTSKGVTVLEADRTNLQKIILSINADTPRPEFNTQIGILPKSSTKRIIFQRVGIKGSQDKRQFSATRDAIDIREQFYDNKAEEWKFTRKGVNIAWEQIKDFQAIIKAIE